MPSRPFAQAGRFEATGNSGSTRIMKAGNTLSTIKNVQG